MLKVDCLSYVGNVLVRGECIGIFLAVCTSVCVRCWPSDTQESFSWNILTFTPASGGFSHFVCRMLLSVDCGLHGAEPKGIALFQF